MIDPWVSANPLCPEQFKAEDGIGKLDYILITHGHFDHIGDAVPICEKTEALTVAVFETANWLGKQGIKNTAPMNKGGSYTLDGSEITVTMVHADHSCGITDTDGSIIYGGEAVGYVVKFENGYTIYHAGDTAVFSDMALIAELYQPDLCMLPIGDRFIMSPKEAARAVKFMNPKIVIPMHYGTFPLLTGTPEALKEHLGETSAEIVVLQPGETLD